MLAKIYTVSVIFFSQAVFKWLMMVFFWKMATIL